MVCFEAVMLSIILTIIPSSASTFIISYYPLLFLLVLIGYVGYALKLLQKGSNEHYLYYALGTFATTFVLGIYFLIHVGGSFQSLWILFK